MRGGGWGTGGGRLRGKGVYDSTTFMFSMNGTLTGRFQQATLHSDHLKKVSVDMHIYFGNMF